MKAQMRYEALSIPLDKSHNIENSKPPIYYQAPRTRKVVEWLREYLKKDLVGAQHCPNCGGVIPELMFTFEGKEYWFTCHLIRESDRTIVKTDYEKFASFCNKRLKPKE